MNASDADLWKVFDYEVEQFCAMCQLLAPGNTEYEELPHHVRNAVVESAVWHARILADIVLSRGKNSDDINLSGLLPDFAPQKLEELRAKYGNSHDKGTPCWTINKNLAHPTSWRGSSFDYSAPLNQIAPLIESVIHDVNQQRAKLMSVSDA